MNLRAPLQRFGDWVRRLPRAVLIAFGLLLVGGAAVGSYLGYRTYDYVQHDNDFCLSCHLMVEPYERFARSAHRGLGCKACHQPTMAARSKMALTQIVVNPEAIETHAEVPNETCEECHVRGNPEEWRLIAASAGHRLHFESEEPSLKGLKCVQCHSTSLHEFAAADRTCSQAGCHENVEIRLGRMSNLSLHCAVCHEFNRPISEVRQDSLASVLRPRSQECLSCHEMRRLALNFPANDPHGGVCGSCHNPHEQTTPAQAAQRCTDCHEQPDTITHMHRGLASGVLQQCSTCHQAHDFRSAGKTCLDCHQDIFNDPPSRVSSAPAGTNVVAVALRTAALAQQTPGARPAPAQPTGGLDSTRFRHSRHRQLPCADCHDTAASHGALIIRSGRDCHSCHHTGTAAARCDACHQPAEYGRTAYRRNEPFRMSVGAATRTRALSFNHAGHEQVACARCHTEPLTRAAAGATCTACHDDHHRADQTCRACHAAPPAGAHPIRSHVGCGGSGCHSKLPAQVATIPNTREFCLVCHQDLVQHQPGKSCTDCHVVPRGRGAALPHPIPVPVAGRP